METMMINSKQIQLPCGLKMDLYTINIEIWQRHGPEEMRNLSTKEMLGEPILSPCRGPGYTLSDLKRNPTVEHTRRAETAEHWHIHISPRDSYPQF